MAKPKYLIQERKGQRSVPYIWTPVLAKRKDMRPITVAEYKKYIEDPNYGGEFENDDFIEDLGEDSSKTEVDEYISDDDEDSKILDSLDAETTSPIDGEAKPLEVTQDDILKQEAAQINRFKKKASIEEYMLRKYHMTLLQMDEVDEMKQQAVEILGTLASTNSLYMK